MKRFLQSFVLEYRAVLDMKKKYDFNHFRVKAKYNSLISFVLACFIFTGIGFLFNESDIHYIYMSINIIVLGTFLMNRLSREIPFKHHYKLDYKIRTQIIYELLYVTIVTLFTNELISLILFRSMTSVIYLMTQGIILIACLIVYFELDQEIYYQGKRYSAPRRTNVLLTVSLFTIQYIVLLYALDIESISLSYIVASVLVYLPYTLISLYFQMDIHHLQFKNYLTALLICIILFSVLSMGNQDNYIQREFLSGKYMYNETLQIETELEFKPYKDDIYFTNHFIYIEVDNILYKYNPSLELVETFDYRTTSTYIKYQVYTDDQIYLYQSEVIEDNSNISTDYLCRISNIADQTNIIEYPSKIIDSINDTYDMQYYNEDFYVSYELEDLNDRILLYQDDFNFIGFYDGPYTNEIYRVSSVYSKGNVLLNIRNSDTNNDELFLIDAEDYVQYLNEDEDIFEEQLQLLEIEVPPLEQTDSYDIRYELHNYYDNEDQYYININDYICVYDSDFNLINQSKVVNTSNDSTIIFSDFGFYEFTHGENSNDEHSYISLKSLDIDYLNNQYVVGEFNILNSTSLILIYTLLLSINIEIPGLKNGGEVDE